MSSLSVHYYAQKKSWVDASILCAWFHNRFVPHVNRFCRENSIDYKVLLLLDNAPAHLSSDSLASADGKVMTMFLPSNTTFVLQPMDQGILEALIWRYKKQLLRYMILEGQTSSLSVPEIVKQLTFKDAVYWCAQAWDEATPQILSNGWNKLLPRESLSTDDQSAEGDVEEVFHDLGYEA